MFEELQLKLQSIASYMEPIFGAFEDYAYLGVAFVAACAYLLARLMASYLPDMLQNMAKRFNTRIHADVVAILRFPLFNLIFLAGLLLAVHIAAFSTPVAFASKAIIKSIMIAVVGLSVYRFIKIFLEHTSYKGGKGIIQIKTLPLFTNTAMVFVLIGASHQIFQVWNVDMTALLASAGIAGLAIGMAAKDMLSDVIAGVLILTDNPYNVGDIIQLESGESAIKGRVTRIGMRSTRILNEYNVEIIMPNSLMAATRILNESSSPKKIGIGSFQIRTASNVDSHHIRRLFTEIILSHPEVLRDEELEVLILDFDDRIVTWELVFCTAETDWEEHIAAALRETIYQRMIKDGIQFALPTEHDLAMLKMVDSKQEIAITHLPDSKQDIHIKEMPNEPRTLHVKEVPNLFGTGPVKIDNLHEQATRQRRTEPHRSIPRSPLSPLTTSGQQSGEKQPPSPPQEATDNEVKNHE